MVVIYNNMYYVCYSVYSKHIHNIIYYINSFIVLNNDLKINTKLPFDKNNVKNVFSIP